MLRIAFFGLCLVMFASSGFAEDERFVYIDVVGAPGDGEQALENALSNRFLDQGFTVTGTPKHNAYEIQGAVKLVPAKRGRETISIDWTIFGPQGTYLGNTNQTKEIRKGALNERWGPSAEAAASAAVLDILQLLPQ